MEGGIIQQAAAPIDVYLRPSNRFVASFVGANNFLKVENLKGESVLKCCGGSVSQHLPADPAGPVVCALRPEDISVKVDEDPSSFLNTKISIPVQIKEVSFVGREMEIFATTDNGEALKAVGRSDSNVIALPIDSRAWFCVERENLSFFKDNELGERV
jgi:iron(III) transport system ATP-binding protein